MTLRGREDLLASLLLGRLALEVGLVEACHRVAHVRRVVDRQVLAAVLVDVGKLVLAKVVSVLGVKFRHGLPP
jgi:hypothetical protein